MARRKTHEEFVAEVKALVGDEYTVLGTYRTAKTKLKIRHEICGQTNEVIPDGFLRGVRCSSCFKNERKTTDKFKEEVLELVGDEYRVAGEYTTCKNKVKFFHVTCGRTFEMIPNSFLRGQRCSKCFKKSRKTTQEFSSEVLMKVGRDFEVIGEYRNAKTPIEIKHRLCGRTFETTPDKFLSRKRCTKCSLDEKTKRMLSSLTDFLSTVDSDHLKMYEILGEYRGVSRRVDIKCNECSHIFKMTPTNFRMGKGCPECAKIQRWDTRGRITTEKFQQNLDKRYPKEFEVIGEYKGADVKILIKHKLCGHVKNVNAGSAYTHGGCPRCRESKGERTITDYLERNGLLYQAQKPIKYKIDKRPLFLDFYVNGIAIEYDGEYHYKPMPHAGGEKGLRIQQRRDAIKTQYCADNGIPLIRIPYWDFDNIDAILTEKLLPLLDASSTKKQAS